MTSTSVPSPTFIHRLGLAARKLMLAAQRLAALWLSRWLLFSFSSLALYVLGWPMWTVLRLGVVPWYDWQWYAAGIALALAVGVWALWRWQRWWVWALCIMWAIGGIDGFGQTFMLNPHAHPVPRMSFWAFYDPAMMTDALLQDLHDAGGVVYLTPRPDLLTPATAAELRRWEQAGVQVHLALVLDDFLYAGNAAAYITQVEQAVAWVTAEKLEGVVVGFIGDAEVPMHRGPDAEWRDQAAFWQAVADLHAFRTRLATTHPHLKNEMTAAWPWYLDRADGDADLALVSRAPVDPPGWDDVNVMAYTSYMPPPARAYGLYLLEETVRQRYPTASRTFLLGIVGSGMPGEPILDYASLVRDVHLSRALGVAHIGFFHLNGGVQEQGPDFVRQLLVAAADPAAPAVTVPFSRVASAMLWGALILDATYDLRGWRGGLLGLWGLGWAVWFWRTARPRQRMTT